MSLFLRLPLEATSGLVYVPQKHEERDGWGLILTPCGPKENRSWLLLDIYFSIDFSWEDFNKAKESEYA